MGLIVNRRKNFQFTDETKLSSDAKDIVSRLLCDVDHRLGTNCKGVQEMKGGLLERNHPHVVLGVEAGYAVGYGGSLQPEVKDTQKFEKFEESDSQILYRQDQKGRFNKEVFTRKCHCDQDARCCLELATPHGREWRSQWPPSRAGEQFDLCHHSGYIFIVDSPHDIYRWFCRCGTKIIFQILGLEFTLS